MLSVMVCGQMHNSLHIISQKARFLCSLARSHLHQHNVSFGWMSERKISEKWNKYKVKKKTLTIIWKHTLTMAQYKRKGKLKPIM